MMKEETVDHKKSPQQHESKQTDSGAKSPGRSLPVWKKALFALIPLVLLFALLEGGLWLFRYESPAADPYESFVFRAPLFVEDDDNDGVMITDYTRRLFFHEQEFKREKPAGVKRVFVFGGSTTFGYGTNIPPEQAYIQSYVHQLGELLAEEMPDAKIEMINCGGKSYASYRLVDLVEESMDYSPDLVIVMSGHNEFIEARHYKELIGSDSVANRAWYSLKSVRLFHDLSTRMVEQKRGTFMEENPFTTEKYIVRDEQEFALTLDHYTRNLNRMVDACRKHDVPIILCTCPSNLEHPPFYTEPPAGMSQDEFDRLAIEADQHYEAERFDEALAVCEQFLDQAPTSAFFNYIAGMCYLRQERYDDARRCLLLAKEHDAFPKRALDNFNERVREIAKQRDAPLFDAQQQYYDVAEHGIPGDKMFLDDCHPRADAHLLFAEGLKPLALRELAGVNQSAATPTEAN